MRLSVCSCVLVFVQFQVNTREVSKDIVFQQLSAHRLVRWGRHTSLMMCHRDGLKINPRWLEHKGVEMGWKFLTRTCNDLSHTVVAHVQSTFASPSSKLKNIFFFFSKLDFHCLLNGFSYSRFECTQYVVYLVLFESFNKNKLHKCKRNMCDGLFQTNSWKFQIVFYNPDADLTQPKSRVNCHRIFKHSWVLQRSDPSCVM